MSGAHDSYAKDHGSSALRSIGDYQIERELGRGAFGIVYLARSRRLDRLVALKVMLDPDLADPEDRARFLLEAQVAARLQAPGIVTVHDIGEEGGRPFFVMDYCPGQTLSERIKLSPLAPVEAAQVVAQLAESMVVAHGAGVLHRDLKPANVILDAETRWPQITDFGLARDRSLLRSMTRTGDVLGTPVYMAPEQIRGDKHLDPRADIYALGAILFCCLTGQPPLRGRNFFELSQLVQHATPPAPSQLRPGVPAALDAICAQALAKDPADRQADCDVLRTQLEAFLGGRSVGLVSRRARGPWLVGGLAVGLLAAAGGILALALARQEAPGAGVSVSEAPPSAAPPSEAPSVEALLARAAAQRTEVAPYEAVEATLQEALARATALGSPARVEQVQLALGELQLARGRFAQAGSVVELGSPRALLVASLSHMAAGHELQAEIALRGIPEVGGGVVAGRARVLREVLQTRNYDGEDRRERYRALRATLAIEAEARRDDSLVLALAASTVAYHDWEQSLRWLAQAEALAPDDATVRWIPLRGLERHLERAQRRPEQVLERRGTPVTPAEIEGVRRQLDRSAEAFLSLTEGSSSALRARLLTDRGLSRVMRNATEAGWLDLREALAMTPCNLTTNFHAGVAARKRERPDEAARLWRTAWAAGPGVEGRYLTLVSSHESDLLESLTGQRAPHVGEQLLPAERQAYEEAIGFEDVVTRLCHEVDQPEFARLRPALVRIAQGGSWESCAEHLPEPDQVMTGTGALALALACAGRGASEEALSWVARARALGADELATLRVAGEAQRQAGQHAEARRSVERVLELDPEGAAGWHARAVLALWDGDLGAAVQGAARALELDPDDWPSLDLRAYCAAWSDPEQALIWAVEARARHGDLSLLPLVARALAELRQVELAQRNYLPELLQAVLLKATPGTEAIRQVAEGYLRLLSQRWVPQLGEACWSQIKVVQGRAPDDARGYVLEALLAQARGDEDASKEAYARARARDPSLPRAGEGR